MRQITLNECQNISGGVVSLAALGGAAALGGMAANMFNPTYPPLGHVLGTIGAGASGYNLAEAIAPGYGIIAMIGSAALGFWASTHPNSAQANHNNAVIGGGITAATLVNFLIP